MLVSAFNNDDRGRSPLQEKFCKSAQEWERLLYNNELISIADIYWYKQSAKHKVNRVQGPHYVSTNLF